METLTAESREIQGEAAKCDDSGVNMTCSDTVDDADTPGTEKDAPNEAAESSLDAVEPTSISSDKKILATLRQSLLPFSDRLDPFAALPIVLDRFQEHLVSFYLLYYPKVTYGFSPRLRPHPVATKFQHSTHHAGMFRSRPCSVSPLSAVIEQICRREGEEGP